MVSPVPLRREVPVLDDAVPIVDDAIGHVKVWSLPPCLARSVADQLTDECRMTA